MTRRGLREALLEQVPEGPLTVETRAILLSSDCEAFGDVEDLERAVVRDRTARLVAAIGDPAAGPLTAATAELGGRWDLIAPIDRLEALAKVLPGWRPEPAEVLALPAGRSAAAGGRGAIRGVQVRSISEAEPGLLDHLEGELGREIRAAVGRVAMTAAFVDGLPASFCYSYRETETWWDVSIDTLEGYRRRGLAAVCAAHLVDRQLRRGKRPVWGALESNAASLALARRLGFEPCGRLAVLERGVEADET